MPWPAAVFFDLDGCLVDSTRAIVHSLNHGLTAVGVGSRHADDLRRFIGPPLFESFAVLLREARADPALAGRCVDAYRDVYPDVARRDTEVFVGVPDVLDRLAGGRPVAVVTSKPRPSAALVLDAVGLADRFVAVHAPELDDLREPKAATLARALADVAPAQAPASTVMVGDRSHDVVAGQVCGTATVGVTWGAGDRDELEAAGADVVVDTPAQLSRYLLG